MEALVLVSAFFWWFFWIWVLRRTTGKGWWEHLFGYINYFKEKMEASRVKRI